MKQALLILSATLLAGFAHATEVNYADPNLAHSSDGVVVSASVCAGQPTKALIEACLREYGIENRSEVASALYLNTSSSNAAGAIVSEKQILPNGEAHREAEAGTMNLSSPPRPSVR